MKLKQILSIAIVMLLIFHGCNKDSDSPDLASNAVGLYEGTWDVQGTRYGTCEVIRVTNTTVKLNLKIMGIEIPDAPNLTVTDGGNGKIYLKYADSSATISATINGKAITLKLTDGTITINFSGTKP